MRQRRVTGGKSFRFESISGRQINECVWRYFNVFVLKGEGEKFGDRGCPEGRVAHGVACIVLEVGK